MNANPASAPASRTDVRFRRWGLPRLKIRRSGLHRQPQLSPAGRPGSYREAYAFAKRPIAGQKRYSGEPYITHPLAVAGALAGMADGCRRSSPRCCTT